MGEGRISLLIHACVETYDVSTRLERVGGLAICERAIYGPGRTWARDSVGYTP